MNKQNHKLKIVYGNKLEKKHFADMQVLVELCKNYDEVNMNEYFEIVEKNYTSISFYSNSKLVCVFLINISTSSEKSVLNVVIHPEFRSKDYFYEFAEVLKNYSLKNQLVELTCGVPRAIQYLGELLKLYGGSLDYSAYEMKFINENYEVGLYLDREISLKNVTYEEIDSVISGGMDAFGTTKEAEESYIISNLKNPENTIFVASIGNEVVGSITVNLKNCEAKIVDFAILKIHRRKGYGNKVLSKVIDLLLEKNMNNLNILVTTKNQNAIAMYERNGFKLMNVTDHYRL